MGDSQTWGTNITRDEAWPAALGRRTGRTAYNTGIGGYGALQFLALTEKARTLGASIVVVGFFFGNDLYDAHRFAGLDHWRAYRDPELDYPDRPASFLVTKPAPNLVLRAVDALMEYSRVV